MSILKVIFIKFSVYRNTFLTLEGCLLIRTGKGNCLQGITKFLLCDLLSSSHCKSNIEVFRAMNN